MDVNVIGWIIIVFFLFVTTFGLYVCINILLICTAFIAGILTMLYLAFDNNSRKITTADLLDNPLDQSCYTSSLSQVMLIFNEPKKVTKTDKRITGSESVDSFLHEIFGFIIRDHVESWYSIITSDKEFIEGIRHTAQSLAVNVSNKIKSVDWLTYLMGRPVEDVACHLRLFRGAGGGSQHTPSRLPRRGSPARSPPNNTPQQHRRNKSDTDVASFAGTQKNISNSRFYIDSKKKSNLSFEQKFFELEREMERHLTSREKICTDSEMEMSYLAELCQLLFYVAMDADDFKGGASLSVMRAVCCVTIQSALTYITEPDTLNTLLLRCICRDGISSESFLSVIRSTNNVEEIRSTLELVKKEIQNIVSHDTVGECDITVKQQLSSLQYLVRMLNTRSSVLTPLTSSQLAVQPPIVTQLPMSFLLDNHLALCYFLDYAQSVGAHAYIFCHLSIQAWRAAAIKYLTGLKADTSSQNMREGTVSSVKLAAQGIYDQYLGSGSLSRVEIPQTAIRNLLSNLSSPFNEKSLLWFQEIEDCIYVKLTAVETGFKNSKQYSRLLAELDIENSNSTEMFKFAEYKGLDSNNQLSYGSKTSLSSLSDSRLSDNSENDTEKAVGSSKFFFGSKPNSRSQSPGSSKFTDVTNEFKDSKEGANNVSIQTLDPQKHIQQWIARQDPCHLEAVIVETGLVQERGRPFGVYAVEVRRRCPKTSQQYCWHVYRRYSDFHELNNSIKETFPELSKMEFPSKKTFHNTSRTVLERRMEVLSTWLSTLTALGSPGGPPRYASLHSTLLLPFLSPKGPHDNDKQNQQRGIDSMLVQPLRQGMRTLKGVPGQLFNTVDDFMEGLSKVLNGGKSDSAVIIPCHLQTAALQPREGLNYGADELPLRVLLLLLDEIFELRKRNQWLRRQIAALLRQLLTAMFADVLNKRIIEFISSVTSPETIVQCLDVLKRTYWSTGNSIIRRPCRDAGDKARARVAVKAALLSACQEELKHIIGSETTHRGLMTVFELIQNPILNKRLIFVLAEGICGALYFEQDMNTIFKRLLKTSTFKMSHLQVT